MRISDWSSDVCSSDLCITSVGEQRRRSAAGRTQMRRRSMVRRNEKNKRFTALRPQQQQAERGDEEQRQIDGQLTELRERLLAEQDIDVVVRRVHAGVMANVEDVHHMQRRERRTEDHNSEIQAL